MEGREEKREMDLSSAGGIISTKPKLSPTGGESPVRRGVIRAGGLLAGDVV